MGPGQSAADRGKRFRAQPPHASMVFDLHGTTALTAELLNGGGVATETVRFANLVSFTCLKAFAFDPSLPLW